MLITLILILLLIVPVVLVLSLLYWTADYKRPDIKIDRSRYVLKTRSDFRRECDNGLIIRNEYGLWEVCVSGSALDRGGALGSLSDDLLAFQEDAFALYIKSVVPSKSYLKVLFFLTIVFTRRMARHIPHEYRVEIAAMSEYSGHRYDSFADPYVRQLNYHAAHDIGHALEDYMLVGCSSLAVWGSRSEGGKLLVARNFDFYAGEDFSKNKVVLFVEPDSGYSYASVSWPGMVGVVSGMNVKGLTVTVNASKGRIPPRAFAPVSILARYILQYASSIEEAVAVAESFRTFVSENILIGSGSDGRAVVIEKTPKDMVVYDKGDEMVICTNHFQSSSFDNDRYNIRNKARTDSVYRYERIKELAGRYEVISPASAVGILRDRCGVGDAGLGFSNPKSVNQLIAHHSVIFLPEELKMWVSTSPWQSGEFVCYDLNDAFLSTRSGKDDAVKRQYNIPEEEGFKENILPDILQYRELTAKLRLAIASKTQLDQSVMETLVRVNADYYETYDLLGDYNLSQGDKNAAVKNWETALLREIPTMDISEKISKKIKKWSGTVK